MFARRFVAMLLLSFYNADLVLVDYAPQHPEQDRSGIHLLKVLSVQVG